MEIAISKLPEIQSLEAAIAKVWPVPAHKDIVPVGELRTTLNSQIDSRSSLVIRDSEWLPGEELELSWKPRGEDLSLILRFPGAPSKKLHPLNTSAFDSDTSRSPSNFLQFVDISGLLLLHVQKLNGASTQRIFGASAEDTEIVLGRIGALIIDRMFEYAIFRSLLSNLLPAGPFLLEDADPLCDRARLTGGIEAVEIVRETPWKNYRLGLDIFYWKELRSTVNHNVFNPSSPVQAARVLVQKSLSNESYRLVITDADRGVRYLELSSASIENPEELRDIIGNCCAVVDKHVPMIPRDFRVTT
jgi:hypothetical protein